MFEKKNLYKSEYIFSDASRVINNIVSSFKKKIFEQIFIDAKFKIVLYESNTSQFLIFEYSDSSAISEQILHAH